MFPVFPSFIETVKENEREKILNNRKVFVYNFSLSTPTSSPTPSPPKTKSKEEEDFDKFFEEVNN
jgi:hypothetical protein